MTRRIDLHAHSTASDGSLSPAELVKLAKKNQLGAVALTDHDTIDGIPEFMEAGRILKIDTIPGLEISADYNNRSMHIVGLFIDTQNKILNDTLKEIKQYRKNRNPLIIQKLKELGIELNVEELMARAEGQLGRPHFAAQMIKQGFVQTNQEAFDKYLATGKPGHVDKKRVTPAEAINLINQSGGLSILAHPYVYNLNHEALEEMVSELAGYGLKGIEVYYSEHSNRQRQMYIELAKKYNLAISGGSDFHGNNKPSVELGSGIHYNLSIPYRVLKNLRKVLEEYNS